MFACVMWFTSQEAQAFYNPSTGRWLSRDPIEERGGLNLHGFVGNDPIARFDQDGRQFAGEPLGLGMACICWAKIKCELGSSLTWISGTIGPITWGSNYGVYDCKVVSLKGCCGGSGLAIGSNYATERRRSPWVSIRGITTGGNLPPDYSYSICGDWGPSYF